MLGKVLALAATSLIALLIYLYFYLGFFLPVTIVIEDRGPLHMIYKAHSGAYHHIGPVIEAVEKWSHEQRLRCTLTFGEYLDDPAAIDQDRLRSRGGCLYNTLPNVQLPEDFAAEVRPKKSYVVAQFNGSPSIGPFKVYPKVEEFLQTRRLKQNGPVIETYFVHGEKVTTEFLFPIDSPASTSH